MNKDELSKLLNKSGFPFQIALKNVIESARKQNLHDWIVSEQELPWKNEERGTEGYVDLVLEGDSTKLVIESKRVLNNSNWLFLNASDSSEWKAIYDLRVTIDNQTIGHASWQKFFAHPISSMSEFCVIDGKDRSMIEKNVGNLIDAIESFAVKDIQSIQAKKARNEYVEEVVYIPVIVTNANLYQSKFKANDVNLDKGKIDTDKIEFTEIDIVRFTKTMKTVVITKSNIYSEKGLVTCFIVNPQGLMTLLSSLSIRLPSIRER